MADQDTIAPEYVQQAMKFEGLMDNDAFATLNSLWQEQGKSWTQTLADPQRRDDREFLSGCLYALKTLTECPARIIERKDKYLAELQRQKQQEHDEARERAKSSRSEPSLVRSTPQAV